MPLGSILILCLPIWMKTPSVSTEHPGNRFWLHNPCLLHLCAKDLHAGETGLFVTDPDRLAQIVTNLTENALRYTPEAGRVAVAVARRGDMIDLAVSNTGPAIDSEDLPRVFEEFYVARKYRRIRPEGSGLGLTIVHELVQAMGGSIAIATDPGDGTRFEVELPAMESSG